jgi:hypothetical protein
MPLRLGEDRRCDACHIDPGYKRDRSLARSGRQIYFAIRQHRLARRCPQVLEEGRPAQVRRSHPRKVENLLGQPVMTRVRAGRILSRVEVVTVDDDLKPPSFAATAKMVIASSKPAWTG